MPGGQLHGEEVWESETLLCPKHKTANDKEPAARQQACEIITRRGQMCTNLDSLGRAAWWDA